VEAQPREIQNYRTPDGKSPFAEWLDCLKDMQAIVKIEKRLKRVRLGNLGNYRTVGKGVCELKIDYGPGYRIYFGQIGSKLILLLCGGDKSTQEQDILTAKEYWRDYDSRSKSSTK
jgi:putative addiction module killer protein